MWNWSQLILVSETERHYAPVVTNTAPTDLMANVKKRKRCTQSIIWLHTFSYEEEEEGKKRRKKLQFVLPLGSHRINVIKLTFIPQKWLHQLFFSHNFEHQTQICTEHCPQVMRGTTGNERHQWGDVTVMLLTLVTVWTGETVKLWTINITVSACASTGQIVCRTSTCWE